MSLLRTAAAGVLGPALHVRLREWWIFYRLPPRLRLAPSSSGIRVVLYGVPFVDWTLALADPALWREVEGVGEVVRLPGVAWLANLLPRAEGRRTVVIPMLAFHAWPARQGFTALAPDPQALATLDDKAAFAVYMARYGLEAFCPPTYASPDDARYPLVVKRTNLSAGLGIAVVRSRAELDTALQTDVLHGRRHLLQALVPGKVEYATYGVCKDARLLWTRTYRTDLGAPDLIKSDDTVRHREALATPAAIARQIETVLAPLAYSGPCTIDYKLAPGGTMQIFEINPRLGGTLMLPQYRDDLRQALACLIAHAR